MTQENPPKFIHPPVALDDEAEYQRTLRFIEAVRELPGQLDKLLHFNGDFVTLP